MPSYRPNNLPWLITKLSRKKARISALVFLSLQPSLLLAVGIFEKNIQTYPVAFLAISHFHDIPILPQNAPPITPDEDHRKIQGALQDHEELKQQILSSAINIRHWHQTSREAKVNLIQQDDRNNSHQGEAALSVGTDDGENDWLMEGVDEDSEMEWFLLTLVITRSKEGNESDEPPKDQGATQSLEIDSHNPESMAGFVIAVPCNQLSPENQHQEDDSTHEQHQVDSPPLS